MTRPGRTCAVDVTDQGHANGCRTPYLVAKQRLCDAAMRHALTKAGTVQGFTTLEALAVAARDYSEASLRTGLGAADRQEEPCDR